MPIDLSKLITTHQGGYEDIVAFLKGKFGDEPYQGKRGEKFKKVSEILDEILENAHSTGVAASEIGMVLSYLKLPILGHKDWEKPCTFWESKRKKVDEDKEDPETA